MKKLFVILVLTTLIVSCKNKKEEVKKPEERTTILPKKDTSKAVPAFSDPEIQKAANEYAVIMAGYSETKNVSARFAIEKRVRDWLAKNKHIGLKMARLPEDSTKWADWSISLLIPKRK